MALQLKHKRNINWQSTATKSAIIVGATYLILRTFPHLKSSLYSYITGTSEDNIKRSDDKKNDNDENYEPIELDQKDEPVNSLEESAVNITQSQIDVAEWSNSNLKSWLGGKEISPPPNASHDNLVALVKSIQETSNEL